MAAAAAAAAAAVTAAIQVLGAKQYTTAYTETVPLKDSNFEDFDRSLFLQAFSHGWADWVIDPNHPEPANLTQKEAVDKKNAYMLIINKCQGSQVAHAMASVQVGNSKAAYQCFFDFFHRATHAGRAEATKTFYNATMANTDTNIIQWPAYVFRTAKILTIVGG